MSDAVLTKAAEEVLCDLYGEYKAREKSGVQRKSARCFTFSESEDPDILKELHNAGFIRRPDWTHFVLEDAAIVYMENRPGLISKALEMAGKIKNAVPFV